MKRYEFIDRYDKLRSNLVFKEASHYLLFNFNPYEVFYSCVSIEDYLGKDAVQCYNEIMGTFDDLIEQYYCTITEFDTLDRIVALEMFYQHCLYNESYKNF